MKTPTETIDLIADNKYSYTRDEILTFLLTNGHESRAVNQGKVAEMMVEFVRLSSLSERDLIDCFLKVSNSGYSGGNELKFLEKDGDEYIFTRA